MNDDAKKTILARRAKFLAAAVAGLAVACGKEQGSPQPCLSEAFVEPDAQPMPCLKPVMARQDAGSTTASQDAEPMPCLSVAMPPEDAGAPRGKNAK